MYFKDWEELEKICPVENGEWNRELLYEYLVQSCNERFAARLDGFFPEHREDEALADMLFDFLSDEGYDGSDCQIGAAHYIAGLERNVLKKKKERLLLAQKNGVLWKRPFRGEEYLEWL